MPILQDLMSDLLTKHSTATETHNSELMEECLEGYNDLLNQFHTEPSLLFSVATIFLQKGWHGLAINLLEYLLKTTTDELRNTPQIWNNLGTAYKGEHIDGKARECWLKALELANPETEQNLIAEYHSNLATLSINNGDPEVGYEHILKACELQPDNNKTWWNRSLLELEMGDYEQGFINYDYGIATLDRLNRWSQIPYYEGQDLKGKRVLVYGEQGMGDEIMFASAIPELISAVGDGHVVYECHDRLESLMKRTFPDTEIHPTRKEKEDPDLIDPETIDYRLGVGSLFRWFGVKKRKPYLIPDPALVDLYQEKLDKLGDGLKVGVGYAAGHKKTHGHVRSFKLGDIEPILSVENCQFISLQYTEEATGKFSRNHLSTGIKVHHWPDTLFRSSEKGFNYDHTVALISVLDVCVLPNTTAVHVCGTLGTECYSLTPDASAWRYRNGDDHMVMYEDHVTLARQNPDHKDKMRVSGSWDMALGDTTIRLVKKACQK